MNSVSYLIASCAKKQDVQNVNYLGAEMCKSLQLAQIEP